MNWNYESKTEKSTGYEDVMDYLKTFTRERFLKASSEEQQRMIDEVYDIYTERGIFPITYFNEDGIKKEIQRGIDCEVQIKDKKVNCGRGECGALCNFMFPNLYDAYKCNAKAFPGEHKESAKWKFENESLKACIKFAIKCDNSACPQSVYSGIRQVGSMPSNFRPMNAKAIYEKFCPDNGLIYDYACGFGGRLTGALTSKKNFTYVGVEPNSETYENLHKMGKAIESVTGRKNSFRIFKIGSEDFRTNPEIFDFAFSSPPYFNLEIYTDEPTQCYNKFPNIYDWLDKYANVTIQNIYYMLKPNRYYAVNIADFDYEGKRMNYVDIWKDMSIKAGFEYYDTYYLRLASHSGVGEFRNMKGKQERIMIFYKRGKVDEG